ncbi:MAG: DMT family transporter [Halodesulfurarchaeum sp.]
MSAARNLGLWMALAAIWGTAFMAIKAGLEPFGSAPVFFAAVRYDLAAVLMLAYAVLTVDPWRPANRGEWGLVAIGGILMIAGYHAFLFVGEQHTTSAVAAVIVSTSPILTTGFARALLPGERLTVTGITGLLLGLLGVLLLAEPDPAKLLAGHGVGEFLVLLAALSFALGSVLTRWTEATLPVETMEAWSMIVGAIGMHAISVAIGENAGAVVWNWTAVWSLLYLSLVASAGGFLIYFDLLERLGPIEINLVSYVAPVWAALAGWLVLGEGVGLTTAVGFGLIFLGFWLLKREALAREVERVRNHLPTGSDFL